MTEDRTVTLVVPSRLVSYINFGFQFDHPLMVWRWYWIRERRKYYYQAAVLSPFLSGIMSILVTSPENTGTVAHILAMAIVGVGTVFGLNQLQRGIWCKYALLKLERSDLIEWPKVKERIYHILDDESADAHFEEVEILLKPEDPK